MKTIRFAIWTILLPVMNLVFCPMLYSGEMLPLASFHLQDYIAFPTYFWPRTLLHYHVDFEGRNVGLSELRLRDAEGVSVPFQITDAQMANGLLRSATISFFSDLPSGGKRDFTLVAAAGPEAKPVHPVTANTSAGGIEIHGGQMSVRLPHSQDFPSGAKVPGPIMALDRGHGWIGHSRVISPHRRVLSVKTEPVVNGDLFQVWRVEYTFEGNASYIATVTVASDYDFIEFDEVMKGLGESDAVVDEMAWTHFAPTCRFGCESYIFKQPERQWPAIDWNATTAYNEEDPCWDPGVIEDVSQEMWMKLSPGSGNGVRELCPSCSFWSDLPGGDELGVFALHPKQWVDHNYGIWQTSSNLMVSFRYRDGLLTWRWPLRAGTRQTGINYNATAAGEQSVEKMRQTVLQAVPKPFDGGGGLNWSPKDRFRYNRMLQQEYGPLCLDQVKDWVLTYHGRRPANIFEDFTDKKVKSAADLIHGLFSSSFVFYPLGQGGPPGVDSINHRFFYDWAVQGLLRYGDQFTPTQRQRVDALLLLAGYVLCGDDMHPIRNCLDGTPNIAADGWSEPMQVAFLYPDHPMAREWRDYYAKEWQVNSFYYTRPDVRAWDCLGGRWTESISVYNWAQLTPTKAAQVAGFMSDGINRWADRPTALRGRWLVDMLTAPVSDPDPLWRQDFRHGPPSPPPPTPPVRAYPAYGSHGSGSTIVVPSVVGALGYFLRNYDPLTAEHLLWALSQSKLESSDKSNDNNRSTSWLDLVRNHCDYTTNSGTPPDLRSCKYTGQGIMLRADVGQPDELSILLGQIDRGPNYRWGWAGEGACGSLFFYQGGKVWTGTEREDTGDHAQNAADGVTSFAVMKDGAYHGIGQNVLDRPLMDLGFAQFAEIDSRPGSPGWPEYRSRTVFLVGADYFLIQDQMGTIGRNAGRFSWFVPKDCEFPEIIFLDPASAREDHYREVLTPTAKGFQRDAGGRSVVTFVTSKSQTVKLLSRRPRPLPFLTFSKLQQWNKTGSLPTGVDRVETAVSTDTFFCGVSPISYQEQNESFEGITGVIRHRRDGALQLAIVGTGQIAADGLRIQVATPDTGVSLTQTSGDLSGIICSPDGGRVTLSFGNRKGTLYLDGVSVPSGSLTLAHGRHHWEYTAGLPQPMRPEILRTENFAEGANVFFSPVPGAKEYRVEASSDNDATWVTAAVVAGAPARISHLTNGCKYHLRLVAQNGDRNSEPSPEYPLYVDSRPPEPPDGLDLIPGTNQVDLSWGEVLGVTEYRLYRRKKGEDTWHLLYHGLNRSYADPAAVGVVPHTLLPGSLDNPPYAGVVYQYAVAAVNDNGEGAKSAIRDTDPTSWLNWWPDIARRFKRQSEYVKPPYVSADQEPPLYYPDAVSDKEAHPPGTEQTN